MRGEYLRTLQTAAVERAQMTEYGRVGRTAAPQTDGALGDSEVRFISERDSFYMASISSSGWPYLQHRGGPAGFLKAVGPRRLAFADLDGNRQLISVGNLAEEDRVSLFLMDYRARERLKVLGRARVVRAVDEPEVARKLGVSDERTRMIVIDVVGFDWNCPKHITQRFTRAEVMEFMENEQG
ncbi:pyridoxamine 5'-phosphate oxidase family protein [Pelagicoccus mobilis]|uniref:Pyridoxamine 5'-phosphate oxidase family protein n=1 Tax=Pelagicoccus mobilis TaxID=415221 RepID=A0A934VQB1_9BACT|nr:pyridoxamine 5'-phosphate oxidase family protein [Pelagicoccus mobilis]MBK1876710.1 pyridoxamine 5'-phosphate oxidase family protein [Pelagicoccus mobilis]